MCIQDGINYQWSDGSDTLYTHWDAADDDEHMVGDCVYMDISGGWRRADCERGLRGALCHVPPPSKSPRLPSVFPPQRHMDLGLLHVTANEGMSRNYKDHGCDATLTIGWRLSHDFSQGS